MYCPYCGKENKDTAVFCEGCEKRLPDLSKKYIVNDKAKVFTILAKATAIILAFLYLYQTYTEIKVMTVTAGYTILKTDRILTMAAGSVSAAGCLCMAVLLFIFGIRYKKAKTKPLTIMLLAGAFVRILSCVIMYFINYLDYKLVWGISSFNPVTLCGYFFLTLLSAGIPLLFAVLSGDHLLSEEE